MLTYDLIKHLWKQITWSKKTFGPGPRLEGLLDHITKEVEEVRLCDGNLSEWIDIIILGFDGAWRSGATPEQIVAALAAKQEKNEKRQWPDWRTVEPGKAIEHIRDNE